MISLSGEQKQIIEYLRERKNVVVDAVAGTGKTTLILAVAKEFPEMRIMQMTYNSSLRLDVKERVLQNDLKNIKVHTFHSLAKRYYETADFTTDTELRKIVLNNARPKEAIIDPFELLVLDECQDMTFLFFQFIVKFIRDVGSQIQLLILGDYMQGIYDFKGADIRFLTISEMLWSGFPLLKTQEFQKTTMRMSFRITNQMCSFVNDVMLGEKRMEACRDDMPVIYIRNTTENIFRVIIAEINKLFEQGVQPCEIFILASSVNGKGSSVRKLENWLVERGIPCHVPMLENGKIDDRVIGGKVVFSSFHCVKGRQRKYVFVMGFDNSYHRFYERVKSPEVCPNTLYVAATRAMKGLYLLETDQNSSDRPLKFLKMSHVQMKQQPFIEFRGFQKTIFTEDVDKDAENRGAIHKTSPTDLIRFIQDSVIEKVYPILERIFVVEIPEEEPLEIPNILKTKQGFYEEVSDVNGIAIPCMYYDSFMKKHFPKGGTTDSTETPSSCNVLLELIRSQTEKLKKGNHTFLLKKIEEVPENIEKTEDYLFMANIYLAIQETLYFKLKQIDKDEYDWLSVEMVEKCKTRMDEIVGVDCLNMPPEFEKVIIHDKEDESYVLMDAFLEPYFGEAKRFRFYGRVDLITENIVWEIKCTGKITIEHMLQVVVYKWLWDMSLNPPKEFKIVNIKTGGVMRLESTEEELNTIMLALLKGKYQDVATKTDAEFVAECRGCFE
jgi:hypothetical protein